MFRHQITACAMAGVLGLAVPAPAQEKAFRPLDPVLVAKGNDYLVHYLPSPSLGGGDVGFLHTTPSTGQMTALLRMPADRFAVLGYAADRDRLYVAIRSQVTYSAPGSGLPYAPEVRFHVYAFWLADGSELAHKELKEADVPEKLRAGKPVARGGPIELAEGGLRCFGLTLRFDGKKVVDPPPPK
jgi:hypothetical protein